DVTDLSRPWLSPPLVRAPRARTRHLAPTRCRGAAIAPRPLGANPHNSGVRPSRPGGPSVWNRGGIQRTGAERRPPVTPFEARLEVEAGRPAVILAGELDAATLPLLLDVLELVIERSRQDVVIDLTRLEFIGSAGI